MPAGVSVTVVHEAAIARVDAEHTSRVLAQQPRFQEPVLRNHDVLETNDAVVHHLVELDASLGERHLELSFQGAN